MKKRTVSSWKAKMETAAAAGNPQARKAAKALDVARRQAAAKAAATSREISARLVVQELALATLEAKRDRDPLSELERILGEP